MLNNPNYYRTTLRRTYRKIPLSVRKKKAHGSVQRSKVRSQKIVNFPILKMSELQGDWTGFDAGSANTHTLEPSCDVTGPESRLNEFPVQILRSHSVPIALQCGLRKEPVARGRFPLISILSPPPLKDRRIEHTNRYNDMTSRA